MLATFNGLDLAMVSLVIAGLLWLLWQGARRLDDYEERREREAEEERSKDWISDEIRNLYDQEKDTAA